MKKRATRTQTRSLISMLVKKRPVRVLTRFLISEHMKKWATRPEKKTRRGLNSLSYFKAHEKEIHWTQTRSLISKLVKKRPKRVLICFLVFKLMKKRSTGPEKKTQMGLKKRSPGPKLALSFQRS